MVGEGDEGGGGEVGEDEDGGGLGGDAGKAAGEDAADGDGGVGEDPPADTAASVQRESSSVGTLGRFFTGDSSFRVETPPACQHAFWDALN